MTTPPAQVDKWLAELTLDEKASLTAGNGMWSTHAVERLGIPAIRVTDGPNGARGSSLLGAGDATAACAPCGSALGATWNPALVERVGAMLGEEALTKSCRVLLAPTINLHRSPLGGRGFECYSEDPLLSGRIAAGFVRGVQSQGVATTAKHFVANDAEFERMTMDSVVDERTLREIYLLPFEIAVKEGGALGIMTAYNLLNGTYCAEHDWLLRVVLREEWGFEGFVTTDWFGAGSSKGSSEAGLDLQMPGPDRFFGAPLADAVRNGEVDEATVDAQAGRMLRVWQRIGALDDPGDGEERSVDREDHRALTREAARESIVLLANDGTLPLARESLRKVAVIGPNADRCQIMGGGSASLRPHYRITPLQALRERLGDGVEVVHERGCWTEKTVPPLPGAVLRNADGGEGFSVEFFGDTGWGGRPVHESTQPDGQILFFGPPAKGVPRDYSLRASAAFTPDESGAHTFTLVQVGLARLYVDGQVVLDGVENPPGRGSDYFGMGSREISAQVELTAGRPVELAIEYTTQDAPFLRGVKVGHRPPIPADGIERAVAAARDADVAIVVVGTNADWESEGHDRQSMDLPGDQDELIRSVSAANPHTVVLVNAGSPVAMEWADDPAAVLQVWFGGQEMANAIADVLLGDADPSGRLPTTIPQRIEHTPAFGNFPGENSTLRYGEGLLVGYRWYDTRRLPVRFPFGHGLSYARFEIGAPRASAGAINTDGPLTVEVPVTNVSDRRGCEVVQLYVEPHRSRLVRPLRELRAFAKVELDPGESTTVRLELPPRAFAHFDPGDPRHAGRTARAGTPGGAMSAGAGDARRTEAGWWIDAGDYTLRVGRSAAELIHECCVCAETEIGPLAP